MRMNLIDITKKIKSSKRAVNNIFFVNIKPAEKIERLYTSSVKYIRNLPSFPSYLQQRGHRCLREAVKCISIITRSIMARWGTIANILIPRAMETNQGFNMIQLCICYRQNGHFIEIELHKFLFTFIHTQLSAYYLMMIPQGSLMFVINLLTSIWAGSSGLLALISIIEILIRYQQNINHIQISLDWSNYYSSYKFDLCLELLCYINQNLIILLMTYIIILVLIFQSNRRLIMQRKGSKNKSMLADSKNKCLGIDPKILKVYGVRKGDLAKNKNISKTKQKSHIIEDGRQNTQTYDFPQFSISFIDNSYNNQISDMMKDHTTLHKNQENQSYLLEQNRKKDQTIQQKRHLQKCRDHYPNFVSALSKLFKVIDPFNRGTINQMNINNRIPEFSMIFLGKIFRKILEDRLTVTEKEFIKMCEPLLKESITDDLMNFLKSFSSEQNKLKISINLTNQASQAKHSPIKKRVIQEEINKNNKNLSQKKSNHLQELMQIINEKEKKLNQKIQSVKDRKKTVSFNIIEGTKNNQSSNVSNYNNYSKNTSGAANKNYIKFQQIPKNDISNSISPFQHNENIVQQFVPNFTYQLPQSKTSTSKYFQPIKIANKPNTRQVLRNVNNISSSFHHKQSQVNPISTRLMRHSDYNFSNRQPKSDSKRYHYHQQTSKIDQLNSRLQEYLRRSKSKMEKSKLFVLQNSGIML